MVVPYGFRMCVGDAVAVMQVGVVTCGQSDNALQLIVGDFGSNKVLRYGLLELQV